MKGYESDWVFNLVLRLAVIVFLGTLALGLIAGVEPLTTLLRSSTAFAAFVVLGWATSLVWAETQAGEAPESRENATNNTQEPSHTSEAGVEG
jgi:hypothetical protein